MTHPISEVHPTSSRVSLGRLLHEMLRSAVASGTEYKSTSAVFVEAEGHLYTVSVDVGPARQVRPAPSTGDTSDA